MGWRYFDRRFVVSCSLGRVGFDVFRLRQPRLIPNYGASLLLFHRPSGVRISPRYSVAHAITGCGVRRTSDSLPLRLREPRQVFQNHRLSFTRTNPFQRTLLSKSGAAAARRSSGQERIDRVASFSMLPSMRMMYFVFLVIVPSAVSNFSCFNIKSGVNVSVHEILRASICLVVIQRYFIIRSLFDWISCVVFVDYVLALAQRSSV